MRFRGAIRKEGRSWLAEVPVFDALTQGGSRREAIDMLADWFATMVDRRGFRVSVTAVGREGIEVGSADTAAMIGLLIRRQRQRSGLSLAEVAERLGARSRNAYARYERGTSVPTIAKLDELLHAVAPGCDLVVEQGDA